MDTMQKIDKAQADVEREASESFERKGFYLYRGLIEPAWVREACQWLDAQEPKSLVNTWTEQEPGVEAAVFFVVHKGNTPIAKIANDRRMLEFAGGLINSPVYIWSSKVNFKAAWCGAVEYYHQDYVYWKDRGYQTDQMLSCMVCLDPHSFRNAGLCVLAGTHKLGFVEHKSFININGLSKNMIPPKTMDRLCQDYGMESIEAQPGDVLFFHTCLVHGSSHNISPQSRRIILSQLNSATNKPADPAASAKAFNLRRAEMEMNEAKRRHEWFKVKYEQQLSAQNPTFCAPIPEQEKTGYV